MTGPRAAVFNDDRFEGENDDDNGADAEEKDSEENGAKEDHDDGHHQQTAGGSGEGEDIELSEEDDAEDEGDDEYGNDQEAYGSEMEADGGAQQTALTATTTTTDTAAATKPKSRGRKRSAETASRQEQLVRERHRAWNEKYEELKKWRQEHGNTTVPISGASAAWFAFCGPCVCAVVAYVCVCGGKTNRSHLVSSGLSQHGAVEVDLRAAVRQEERQDGARARAEAERAGLRVDLHRPARRLARLRGRQEQERTLPQEEEDQRERSRCGGHHDDTDDDERPGPAKRWSSPAMSGPAAPAYIKDPTSNILEHVVAFLST